MVAPLTLTKRLEKKTRWKLYKSAQCCFEFILEAATYKTAAVWLLTAHFTSLPSKTSKTCRALLEK